MGAMAAFGPWLAPFDPAAQPDIVGGAGQPPGWPHLLGTDGYSRDVLSRLLTGSRFSIGVSLAAAVLTAAVGAAAGLAAGLSGGVIDGLLMRLIDAGLAIPRVVILAAAVAVLGALPLPLLVVLLAGTGWFGIARLVRTDVRTLREAEYIEAARAQGVPPLRLVRRHLLPAVLPTVLVAGVLAVAQTAALEAALSFLGLGVQPPAASWGTLLADAADQPWRWWWLLLGPGVALVGTVLACNALADGLRRRLDVREVAGA